MTQALLCLYIFILYWFCLKHQIGVIVPIGLHPKLPATWPSVFLNICVPVQGRSGILGLCILVHLHPILILFEICPIEGCKSGKDLILKNQFRNQVFCVSKQKVIGDIPRNIFTMMISIISNIKKSIGMSFPIKNISQIWTIKWLSHIEINTPKFLMNLNFHCLHLLNTVKEMFYNFL